ncbi:unnamed protein product [Nippostrongylus brasiliensis]|uniref:Secreted protein n=1 Tax=Nippostrongylus brasiliensis TaxID=27835 RepID=A0A0N4XDF5_NIPBR|nr:unnamed protein product [Nippostrongylus brasiliensis]
MFASQLFFSLAVPLISGHTLIPADTPSCANGPAEFCHHVLITHEVNGAALRLLDEIGGSNGTKRLTQADELVLALLNKTDKTSFRALLKGTLAAELGALVMAKVDCFTPEEPIDLGREATCIQIYADIGLGILELTEAIIAVETDEAKKADIQSLRDKIFEENLCLIVLLPYYSYLPDLQSLTYPIRRSRKDTIWELVGMATLHLRRLLICAILLSPVRTNLQKAVDLCIRIGSSYCYFAVAAYERNNLTLNASKGRLEGDGMQALKLADKLVFEDAAPPKPPTFHELVEKARSENKEALKLLGDELATSPFKASLTEANKLLTRILEDQQQLKDQLTHLKKAVRYELKALREKKECKNLSQNDSKSRTTCKEAYVMIADSLLRTVVAYWEAVPEQRVKDKIEKIIKDGLVEGNGNPEKAVRIIGRNFLKNTE